jgi:hypothetical protein
MNLYGFGGGDPVNYADPFGLCPPDDDKPCPAQQMIDAGKAWLHSAMDAVGDFGNSVMNHLKSLVPDAAIQVGIFAATGGEGTAIELAEDGMAHVLEGHTAGGALSAGKSIFHAAEEVPGLIRAAEGTVPVKQAVGRNFQRIVNAGREIGIDRATGKPTSTYTVITNAANKLITSFPGVP